MEACLLQTSVCAQQRSLCLHSPAPVLGLTQDVGDLHTGLPPALGGARVFQNAPMGMPCALNDSLASAPKLLHFTCR